MAERDGRTTAEKRRDLGEAAERAHSLIHLRLAGWMLIGVWQFFGIVDALVGVNLQTWELVVVSRSLGLLGLILVAYGFEALAELSHQLAGMHD